MALFIAYNSALSTLTDVAAGTSYTSGTARVAIQLQIPDSGKIKVIEWGCSGDASAAATPSLWELATTDTGSTVTTGHTTTTIESLDQKGVDSRLTMGTTGTGYGNGTITSNTTLRPLDRQYIAPTGLYVKMWPLGREPLVGNTTTENFLQLRVKTATTHNAIAYIVWEEHI